MLVLKFDAKLRQKTVIGLVKVLNEGTDSLFNDNKKYYNKLQLLTLLTSDQ